MFPNLDKVLKIGKEGFLQTIRNAFKMKRISYTSEVMSENMMTLDAKEGISAFIEKRIPNWKNK